MNIYNYSLLLITCLMSCTTQVKKQDLQTPTPTAEINHADWVLNESLSDEFDGDRLDATKWFDHNPTWLGREPSLFKKENVSVKNGMLILTGKRETLVDAPKGYHTFSSAAVQSTKKVLYGFFEIKCKAMNSALSSAFWLYTQDSTKQEEIDIFEICGRNDSTPSYDHAYFATSHYIIKTKDLQISDHVNHKSEVRYADKFIVSGLKWTREEIIWYIDGKEIRRRKNDFWHSPETINFDSEAFPSWWGLPAESDNGGEFQIEYFRYWSNKDAINADNIFVNDMK